MRANVYANTVKRERVLRAEKRAKSMRVISH